MILPDEEPSDCEDRRNENYADPNTASVGDFVLVQFLGKKSITYYIGQLLEFTENVEMKTKFLRRSSRKDMNCPSFSFPDNEDSTMRRKMLSVFHNHSTEEGQRGALRNMSFQWICPHIILGSLVQDSHQIV